MDRYRHNSFGLRGDFNQSSTWTAFKPVFSQTEHGGYRDVTDSRERKVSSGSLRSWASASPCSYMTDVSGGSGVTSPPPPDWQKEAAHNQNPATAGTILFLP